MIRMFDEVRKLQQTATAAWNLLQAERRAWKEERAALRELVEALEWRWEVSGSLESIKISKDAGLDELRKIIPAAYSAVKVAKVRLEAIAPKQQG